MQTDSAQVSDPGSIIYIDHIGDDNCDLCGQGVSTYSLTHLMMEIGEASVLEGGRVAYVARTSYKQIVDGQEYDINCIFSDRGYGLTSSTREKNYCHWWIEPVNEASIEESYFGVQPLNDEIIDEDGWYWTSLCCDFPVAIPAEGGVEGAYTVREVELGYDDCYYAEPVKLYGQGDIIPAATPVLIKCKYSYASGNKLIPVGNIANRTSMPISNDLLQGNYFSNFMNRCNLADLQEFGEYIPKQATAASANSLALGIDENGKLGFFPQADGTYMAANTAWLNVKTLNVDAKSVTAVYLGEEPEEPVVSGDANGDGKVDVSDIPYLIDYLLGNADGSTEGIGSGADVNGDGKIDIIDISCLIDKILNRSQE